MPKVFKRIQLGDPILRAKSSKFDLNKLDSPNTKELIKRMFYTLKQTGGVGLAAPQIGKSIQLAVINIPTKTKYHGKQESLRTVVINPIINSYSKKQTTMHEGCLSFLDLFGVVSRPDSIEVTYWDKTGQKVSRKFGGLHAKVFQHEYDHLQGEVWVDKAADSKSFMTKHHYLEMRKKQSQQKSK